MSARGWMRRAGVSAAVLLTMLWAAPAASAAPAAPAQSGVMGLEEWSQQITDSSGVPISKYEALPLDLSLIHISEPTRLRRISYAVGIPLVGLSLIHI